MFFAVFRGLVSECFEEHVLPVTLFQVILEVFRVACTTSILAADRCGWIWPSTETQEAIARIRYRISDLYAEKMRRISDKFLVFGAVAIVIVCWWLWIFYFGKICDEEAEESECLGTYILHFFGPQPPCLCSMSIEFLCGLLLGLMIWSLILPARIFAIDDIILFLSEGESFYFFYPFFSYLHQKFLNGFSMFYQPRLYWLNLLYWFISFMLHLFCFIKIIIPSETDWEHISIFPQAVEFRHFQMFVCVFLVPNVAYMFFYIIVPYLDFMRID